MEIEIEINSCRICLKNVGDTPLFSYLGEENAAEMINSLFSIEVICNDNLPDALCLKCMEKLKIAFIIKEDIINSENMLNTYLETKNTVAEPTGHFLQEINNRAAEVPGNFPHIKVEDNIVTSKLVGLNIEHLQEINYAVAELSGNVPHIKVEDKIVTSKLVGLDIEHLQEINNAVAELPGNFPDIKVEGKIVTSKLVGDIEHLQKINNTVAQLPGNFLQEINNGAAEVPENFLREINNTVAEISGHFLQDINVTTTELPGNLPLINVEDKIVTSKLVGLDIEHLYLEKIEDSTLDSEVLYTKTRKVLTTSFESSKMYDCEKCNFKTDTYKLLIFHMRRTHRGINLFECEQCGKEFTIRAKFSAHECPNKLYKRYKCDVCMKGFSNRPHLLQHLVTHNTERIIPCPHCDKMFCHMKGLKAHLLTHNEKNVICDICGNKFKHTTFLKTHIAKRHRNVPGRSKNGVTLHQEVACEWCGKLIFLNRLRSHIKTVHLEKKSFECPFCDEAFPTVGRLNDHIQYHINSRTISSNSETLDQYLKYKCDKCDKAFTSSINLKNHNIRHSGLKEHVCPHCGKEFAFKHYVERHVRLAHDTTNPRNFVCKVCGKVYAHSLNLKAHMVVHTGELPYHCKFCDIRFRYPTSLRRHMNHQHQTKVSVFHNRTAGSII